MPYRLDNNVRTVFKTAKIILKRSCIVTIFSQRFSGNKQRVDELLSGPFISRLHTAGQIHGRLMISPFGLLNIAVNY